MNSIEILKDKYYIITQKERPYNSILIQGIFLHYSKPRIEDRWFIQEATEAQVVLYAKPKVDAVPIYPATIVNGTKIKAP